MESKAQKAALAEVKKMTDCLQENPGRYHLTEKYLEKIDELINEYDLEDKLLKDAAVKTYNTFMEKGFFAYAAALAKKYGL